MQIPDWTAQLAFGRLGWALVAAALLLTLVSALVRARPLPRAWIALVVIGCLVLGAVPGPAGPGYYLLMAFQSPSALLVALAGLSCLRRVSPVLPAGATTLPTWWAALIALKGGLLYLDISGWVSWGLYGPGLSHVLAPCLALAMSAACVVVIGRSDRHRPHAIVLLAALSAWTLARLPTGNLWDAMLDPLLWAWSVASLGRKAVIRFWRPSRPPADAMLKGSAQP